MEADRSAAAGGLEERVTAFGVLLAVLLDGILALGADLLAHGVGGDRDGAREVAAIGGAALGLYLIVDRIEFGLDGALDDGEARSFNAGRELGLLDERVFGDEILGNVAAARKSENGEGGDDESGLFHDEDGEEKGKRRMRRWLRRTVSIRPRRAYVHPTLFSRNIKQPFYDYLTIVNQKTDFLGGSDRPLREAFRRA